MQRIYEGTDKEPLSDQLLRVDHWEDSDLYEVSISYLNNAAGIPMRKLAKVYLTPAELERLTFSLQAYMEDRTRKEAEE